MALSKYFGCLDWARLLVGKALPNEKGLQEEITRIDAEIKKVMERSRQID